MKYFDIERFNKNAGINGFIFELSDGTKIWQMDHMDHTYTEEIKQKNSPYVTYYSYHKNGVQKSYIKTFYRCNIEVAYEYDIHGEVIKETNNDLPYKFSINDLRAKLKKEYDIDIIEDYKTDKSTTMIVQRWLGYDKDWDYYKKDVPMYQVHFINKENKHVGLEINATNGKTILEDLDGKISINPLRSFEPTPQEREKRNDIFYVENNDDSNNGGLWLLIFCIIILTIIVLYFRLRETALFD